MSETERYIRRLEALKEGDRSRLRRLGGKPLHETVPGFDLFTGLWWPLRRESQRAPRRETSWLVAKLYGAFPIPNGTPSLPGALGRCEPRDEHESQRFGRRFDALLCSPLSGLEPHLRWALSVVADAVAKAQVSGLDWAQLLDDLSIWDRGEERRRRRDIRDIWAQEYLDKQTVRRH